MLSAIWKREPPRNAARFCSSRRRGLVVAGQEIRRGRAPGGPGSRPPRGRRPGTGRGPAARARGGPRRVLRDHGQEPEVVVGVGEQDRVAGRLGEREPLLVGAGPPGSRPSSTPARPRRPARRSGRGRRRRRAGQELGQQGPRPRAAGRAAGTSARSRPTSRRPGPARRWRATSRWRRAGCGPRDRGAACSPRRPGRRSRRPSALGELDADTGVAGLQLRALAALVEPLEGVLAQERVEAEAGLDLLDRAPSGRSCRRRRLDPDEALVGERFEAVSDVDPEVAVGVRDGQAASAVQPPAKTAEPREEPPLVRRQQVVAPGDRAAQRPLPLRQVARPAARGRGSGRAARGSAPGSGAGPGPRRARSRAAGRRGARRSPGSRPRVVVEDEVRPVRPRPLLEQLDAGRRRRAAGRGSRARRRSAAARGS